MAKKKKDDGPLDLDAQMKELEKRIKKLEKDQPDDAIAMVVAANSFDKAMMPFIMGVTAASMGMEVHIFFTFFGINLLKKGYSPKMPGMYMPFTGMMVNKMKTLNIEDFQGQLKMAKELGVNLYACNTSMEMMGIKKEDLTNGIEIVGAAAFLDMAANSKVQLFIS